MSRVTLPSFSMVKVQVTVSPGLAKPSASGPSFQTPLFSRSSDGSWGRVTVAPAVSLASSSCGSSAVAVALLVSAPASMSVWSMA